MYGDDCGTIAETNVWQEKPKYSEETSSSASLSNTDRTWLEPESNPGRCGWKPAIDRPAYGTASSVPETSTC
jgi:hypothetical protein